MLIPMCDSCIKLLLLLLPLSYSFLNYLEILLCRVSEVNKFLTVSVCCSQNVCVFLCYVF